jgi:hypothetical protein
VVPPWQTVPQAPQLLLSVSVGTSQPSAGLPLQFAKPALHEPMAQPPELHAGVALGAVHAMPHAPQLLVSVRTFTSQPSFGMVLQSRKPDWHEKPHALLLHVARALVRGGHAVAQLPQCCGSIAKLTSQPSPGIELQSPRPWTHWTPQTLLVQVAVE